MTQQRFDQNMLSQYFQYFNEINWSDRQTFDFPSGINSSLLGEQGSLSSRFTEHCDHLLADVIQQVMVNGSFLSRFQAQWLEGSSFLLRDIVLRANGQGWLLGRTFIPQTMLDKESALRNQGEKPIGFTVFNSKNASRDAMHFGWVNTEHGRLVARSSRLWMNQQPMLVMELFLPSSPIYMLINGK